MVWSWHPGSVHRWWGTCKGDGAGCLGVVGGGLAEGRVEGWVGRW